jgi:hypothetical protein
MSDSCDSLWTLQSLLPCYNIKQSDLLSWILEGRTTCIDHNLVPTSSNANKTVLWRQWHTLVTESNVAFGFCGCLKHSWDFLSKDYWLVNPVAQVPKKSAGTPKDVRSLLYIPEWFQKKVTPIRHWSQLWWFNANDDTDCSKTSFSQIFTYFNFWTHASVPVVQQIRSSCKTKNILLRHEAVAFNDENYLIIN